MGRTRAITQRRDGSRTGSFQEEICQRNGKVHSAFGQPLSTKEREHTLVGHLDDDLLRKSGWQKSFSATKEDDHEGERRVSEAGWANEVVRSSVPISEAIMSRAV